MSNDEWVKHLEEATGLVRPSKGGDWDAWQEAYRNHGAKDCPACRAREAQIRRNRQRREIHAAHLSCGLVRVRGALGGVYYE